MKPGSGFMINRGKAHSNSTKILSISQYVDEKEIKKRKEYELQTRFI